MKKKLRTLVISDLHFDFRPSLSIESQLQQYDNTVDVVILAGDIDIGFHEEDFDAISKHFSKSTIYFTPGNHDYWYEDLELLDKTYLGLEKKYPNLKILNNCEFYLPSSSNPGRKIIGSTLWFKQSPELDLIGPYCLPDFTVIRNFEVVYKINKRSIKFLQENVTRNSIVVTHFIPTYRSLHPLFRLSNLNGYFICEMDDIIKNNKPYLWIHGHTHASFDYQYDRTRVISNPLGYPHETYTSFNPNKIIEL